MESLLNRYRNITVLLLVIFAQIVLLAYQVKNDSDMRIIRVWAVTAVTPIAQIIEDVRSGTVGFLNTYFSLRDVREENRRMRAQLDRLKLNNQFLTNELATAEHARALGAFEARTPSKMTAARIIGTAAGGASVVVFVDRGSTAGVQKGMAVVTPDGIVGKVLASYPTASQVLMVTDPGFAAGVVSQKNRVRGIVRGQGHGTCKVDYIQNEEKIDVGEMFFTSGDDRVFPKGLPVGRVRAVRPGATFMDVYLDPSGLQNAPEEVLIILEGVHQAIPELPPAETNIYMGPDLKTDLHGKPGMAAAPGETARKPPLTDADRTLEHYREIGVAQGHKFGSATKPPDFNIQPPAKSAAPSAAIAQPAPQHQP